MEYHSTVNRCPYRITIINHNNKDTEIVGEVKEDIDATLL
jgi:hypothetical protein